MGFFQMTGKFFADFFLLPNVQGKAREALANEFLPIRHGPPS